MEKNILQHLVFDEEYARKVLPFVKPEYFSDIVERKIFEITFDYFQEYKTIPTKSALLVELDSIKSISDDQANEANNLIVGFQEPPENEKEWILSKTEKWCQDKAIYNLSLIHI